MAGLLDFLLQDQNTGSQGLLGQLLNGPNGAGTQPVIPPGTPSPGYSAGPAQNYFRPRTGLLGDSILGDALRGGLAGLAGSTGYKGFGAQLGAGALSAEQNMQQRRQQQQGSLLGGQQYQSGQQGLVAGNIANVFALQKLNAMEDDMGLPHSTMQQLSADPNLLYDPTQGGKRQPATQSQNFNPTAQGGQPESTWDNSQGQGGAAPPAQGSGFDTSTPAGRVQQALAQIHNLQWVAPDVYKAKLDEIKSSSDYLAMSSDTTTTATNAANLRNPQTTLNNVKDFASAYQAQPEIKTINELTPVFHTVNLAAQGSVPVSDADLINSTIRIWNPGAASIRPSMVSTIGDVQNIQGLGSRLLAALSGGAPLSSGDRAYLVKSARTHFRQYQQAADTVTNNYRERAKLLPGNVSESQWRADMPSQSAGPAQVQNDADFAALPSGAHFIGPDGKERIKP